MTLLVLGLLGGGAWGTEYYVNGVTGNDAWDGLAPVWDGTHGPKKTIQAAINAASTGDTIYVAAGTYEENIKITKGVTLSGADRTTTIIRGDGTAHVVVIESGNVTIKNFQITSQSSTKDILGIKLVQQPYIRNIVIENNRVCNINTTSLYAIGIWVQSLASDIVIKNNHIEYINSAGLAYGVLLSQYDGIGSNNVRILSNQINNVSGAWFSAGIAANDDVHDVIIENNTIANLASPGSGKLAVGIGAGGGNPQFQPSRIVIRGNIISRITWSGMSFQDAVGIGAKDQARDVTIENNTVIECGVGIGLDTRGPNIQIRHNTLRNNQVGIGLGSAASPDATWVAYENNLAGNAQYGVFNATTLLFNAKNNWWGSVDGPEDPIGTLEVPPCALISMAKNAEAPITGTLGNKVSENVDYCPWLNGPFPGGIPVGSGDVDGDGQVEVDDVWMTLRAALGLITLTPAQRAAADVDGDGDVDIEDARCLARRLIGLSCP